MQRADIVEREFQNLIANVDRLSQNLGLEVVVGLCGSNGNEDLNLGGWYETSGARGFAQNKIGSPKDAISHLQAAVFKNMSLCIVDNLSNNTTEVRLSSMVTQGLPAEEMVDPGVSDEEWGTDWEDIKSEETHWENTIRKGIKKGINALGIATPGQRLHWNLMASSYAPHGIYITNWPTGVHFPGEKSFYGHRNRNGLRNLPRNELESLAAAFEDPDKCPIFHRYKDHKNISALLKGRIPFISECAPSISSTQMRGRRMLFNMSKSRTAFKFDERGEPRNGSAFNHYSHSRSKKRSGEALFPNPKKAKLHKGEAYLEPKTPTETRHYTLTEDISRSPSIEVEGPYVITTIPLAVSPRSESDSSTGMTRLFRR